MSTEWLGMARRPFPTGGLGYALTILRSCGHQGLPHVQKIKWKSVRNPYILSVVFCADKLCHGNGLFRRAHTIGSIEETMVYDGDSTCLSAIKAVVNSDMCALARISHHADACEWFSSWVATHRSSESDISCGGRLFAWVGVGFGVLKCSFSRCACRNSCLRGSCLVACRSDARFRDMSLSWPAALILRVNTVMSARLSLWAYCPPKWSTSNWQAYW